MDYEKLHKDIINKLQQMVNSGKITVETACDICADFVQESEDERIRKELISFVKSMLACHDKPNAKRDDKYESWIAWLERQKERNINTHFPSFDEAQGTPIIKQEEPNPIDKVKLKFHEGNWVVYKNDICQIVKREEGCNKLVTVFGIEKELVNERNLSTARLWTIQDAKPGDVLVSESKCGLNTWYCIFKSLDDESMTVHCYIGRDGRFQTMEELCFDKDPRDVKPATKEQRDILFQKMHEAGYRWNPYEKKLEKIEQKPADTYCQKHCKGYQETGRCFADGDCQAKRDNNKKLQQETKKIMTGNFVWGEEDEEKIKEIKIAIYNQYDEDKAEDLYYYFLEPILYGVRSQLKKKWSKEDDEHFERILKELENQCQRPINRPYLDKIESDHTWLKSLRSQLQLMPSDKHYELEEFAKIVRGNLTGISKAVQKLFEVKYLQLTGNKMYRGFKD